MLVYFFIFFIGACFGSFLNVVIHRLPEHKSVVKKKSHCPYCHKEIKFYDLIPVLSFIWLKGKCRSCGKKISWQYPAVELFTALSFLFIAYHHQVLESLFNPWFFRDLIFVLGLIIIFVADLRYYLVFDLVVIPLAVFALFINLFLFGSDLGFWSMFWNLALSAMLGGGFFWLQYVISKGRWVGAGDIRLGVLFGFMFGWPRILAVLILAYVSGAIISLFLVALKRKNMKSQVPFGVFLSLAALVVLFYGNEIVNWYLSKLAI
ncbi:MAG TPA: prepilin peptidase [Patescibacteria group bacterium]|nr:prepilin peptidase [Patescibacteria group bacterium]